MKPEDKVISLELAKLNGGVMKKYVLWGGFVYSATDEDGHYISAEKLISLYGLPRNECLCINDSKDLMGFDIPKDMIVLCPRNKGDYQEHLNRFISERLRQWQKKGSKEQGRF